MLSTSALAVVFYINLNITIKTTTTPQSHLHSLVLPSAPPISDWSVSFEALFIGPIKTGRCRVEKGQAREADHFKVKPALCFRFDSASLDPRKC